MNAQRRSVNLVPGMSAAAVLHASEGDVGRVLEIVIIDGQLVYNIPSTATVTITATKPSGMGFTQACTVTENGTATFETTASMTDESGEMQAEVRIVDGGKNIGTANLLWVVERNPHPSNVIDGDVERAKTILERAEEAMTKAEQMIEEVEIYNSIVEEVEDIRVGVDGTAYESAGDAVRGQVNGLKDEIDNLTKDVKLLDFKKGAITIPQGADLNNYKTAGNYIVASGAIASSLVNCPSTIAGRFTVMTLNHAQNILQQYDTSSGDMFWRNYSNGTWKSWQRVTDYSRLLNHYLSIDFTEGTTALPSGADLNNYKTAGNYIVTSGAIASSLVNCPSTIAGRFTVMTLNHAQNILQQYQSSNGELYQRVHSSGSWLGWVRAVTSNQLGDYMLLDYAKGVEAIPQDSDLDDYKTSGNYAVMSTTIMSSVKNAPFVWAGRLIVMALNHAQNIMQIYVASSNHSNIDSNIAWRNYTSGAWEAWNYVAKDDYLDEPYKTFAKVAVVGDSMSVGWCYGDGIDPQRRRRNIPFCWTTYIGRDAGTEWFNVGQSGYSTRSFLTSSEGYGLEYAKAKGRKAQAYIIALAINDRGTGVPVGTVSDINTADQSQNADTYYGNYSRIIYEMRKINPKCKVFCMTSPKSSEASYNEAIRDIVANVWTNDNVFLVDIARNPYTKLYTSYNVIVNDMQEGHYAPMAYQTFARIIEKSINIVMRENQSCFHDIPYIPYDTESADVTS